MNCSGIATRKKTRIKYNRTITSRLDRDEAKQLPGFLIFFLSFVALFVFVLLLSLSSQSAHASHYPLRVKIADPVICNVAEGQVDAFGCYDGGTITISKNLAGWGQTFVLYHEFGHYLFDEVTEAEYNQMFGVRSFRINQEIAANYFALWLMGYKLQAITPTMTHWFLAQVK